MSTRTLSIFGGLALGLGLALLAACGGPSIPKEQALPRLRTAITAPVSTPTESQDNSRLVEAVVEDAHLMGMFRHEVEEAIGQGEPCSRHPRCAENGFAPDDWFYTVGTMGEGSTGALPILILGFDTSGRVTKMWNLRTH